jgi:hypothetical protein
LEELNTTMPKVNPEPVPRDDPRLAVAGTLWSSSAPGGRFLGNAALLSPEIAVTVATNLSRESGVASEDLLLSFPGLLGSPGVFPMKAHISTIDTELGLAVLNVTGKPPRMPPKDLVSDEMPAECETVYYDADDQKMGLFFARGSPDNSSHKYGLDLPEDLASTLRGAPVFSAGRVVGIMSGSMHPPGFLEVMTIAAMAQSRATYDVFRLLPPSTSNRLVSTDSKSSVRSLVVTSRTEFDDAMIFARFRASSRNVLERAEGIRRGSRQREIHMEHLIAGLFRSWAGFFRKAGIDEPILLELIRSKAKAQIAQDARPRGLDKLPPMSKHVRQALEAAVRRADQRGAKSIWSTHLLYGALSIEECSLIKVLLQRGLRKEDISDAEEPQPEQDGPAETAFEIDQVVEPPQRVGPKASKPGKKSPDEGKTPASENLKIDAPVSRDGRAGVWITVADPNDDPNLTSLTLGNTFGWAVPQNCAKDDWVFIWLVGGIGFRYICRAVATPHAPQKDEHGPAQVTLEVVAQLDDPITFQMLSDNEELSSWNLVRSSMQGALQKQRQTLLVEAKRWNALRGLILEHNPDIQAVLNDIEPPKVSSKESSDGARPSILLGFKCNPVLWQVLNLAIDLGRNRKQKTRTLSSSAIFFAFLEIGRRNSTRILDAPSFLFDAVSTDKAANQRYLAGLTDYCGGSTALLNDVSLVDAEIADPPSTTDNVARWLTNAGGISEQVADREGVDTTHLLAVLLVDNKSSHAQKRLLEIGLDRNQLRADFYRAVVASRSEDHQREWQRALFGEDADVQFGRVLASYAPDDPEDKRENPDRLDITGDVEAFASVIAAKNLDPPLSIGLFGEWGSGKSFFMSKLRAKIEQLACAARTTDAVFCSQVVQISFNAWHYVDENLWASLVTEVFDKLFERISGGERTDEDARALVKRELLKAQGLFQEAQKELEVARGDLAKAEQALKKLRAEREQKEQQIGVRLDDIASLLQGDAETQKALEEAAQTFGVAEAGKSFKSLETQVVQLQSLGNRATAIGMAILQPPGQWFRIALLGVAFAAPILVGLASASIPSFQLKDIITKIAMWGSLIATLSAWLARQVERGSKAIGRVEGLFTRLNNIRQERKLQAEAEEIGQVESLRQREAAARENVAGAEAKVQTLQREQEELKPGRRLQRFIQEKSRAADYKQHLGLVSLIRQDFMTLSDLLSKREDLPIQRIVLYIDDLDRCPPERVVEVLEAIHLILAFKLFVVVVGVDVRWISKSLADRYHNLLLDDSESREAVASPHDYLEKIFQIPFWIRAMDFAGSQNLIEGLLANPESASGVATEDRSQTQVGHEEVVKADSAVPPLVPQGQGVERRSEDIVIPSTDEVALLPRETVNDNSAAGDVDRPKAATEQSEEQDETLPRRLRIEDVELQFIKGLAAFVGSSPRRIKRFANIYRLLKASVPQKESASFLVSGSQSGEYQGVIVLLAMLTGSPSLAPKVLRDLESAKDETSVEEFKAKLQREMGAVVGREYAGIIGLLEYYQVKKSPQVTLRLLKRWAPRVARFSFRPYTAAN